MFTASLKGGGGRVFYNSNAIRLGFVNVYKLTIKFHLNAIQIDSVEFGIRHFDPKPARGSTKTRDRWDDALVKINF